MPPRAARKRKLTKSEQMARVRSRDTGLELRLRKSLWRAGLRYRLRPRLPGTPDLSFAAARVAVFVDGCFWHGCPAHYSRPATNVDFWNAKLERNRARDLRVDDELRALGWTVCRVWEHELVRNLSDVIDRVQTLIAAARGRQKKP